MKTLTGIIVALGVVALMAAGCGSEKKIIEHHYGYENVKNTGNTGSNGNDYPYYNDAGQTEEGEGDTKSEEQKEQEELAPIFSAIVDSCDNYCADLTECGMVWDHGGRYDLCSKNCFADGKKRVYSLKEKGCKGACLVDYTNAADDYLTCEANQSCDPPKDLIDEVFCWNDHIGKHEKAWDL